MELEIKEKLRRLNNYYKLCSDLKSKITNLVDRTNDWEELKMSIETEFKSYKTSLTPNYLSTLEKIFYKDKLKRSDLIEGLDGELEEAMSLLNDSFPITSLQKYDLIKSAYCNFGIRETAHYGVVYKVIDDLAYVLTITSKDHYGRIKMQKSRMFKDGFFTPCFCIIPVNKAIEGFYGVMDSKRDFDDAVRTVLGLLNGRQRNKTKTKQNERQNQ